MDWRPASSRSALTMRVFTGISLGSDALRAMKELLAQVRPIAHLKWSPVENLHITTKFIGAWPDERLPELERALDGVARPGPVPVRIAGLGFFPGAFYAAVDPAPALLALARATDEALETIGCKRESRPYSPHVTLAKIKNQNTKNLVKRIAPMAQTELGSFEAQSFHLYLSSPTPDGSKYSILRTWKTC